MSTVFNGAARWIEARVKPHTDAVYITLPRQPIKVTPYAWGLRLGPVVSGNQTGYTATQFEVHLRAGDDTVEFSYRLVAKRLQLRIRA